MSNWELVGLFVSFMISNVILRHHAYYPMNQVDKIKKKHGGDKSMYLYDFRYKQMQDLIAEDARGNLTSRKVALWIFSLLGFFNLLILATLFIRWVS